ncbi:flavodoxin [Streptomyces tateyamensis]|uniref:Flavodoxin n=1 Tax=Streptomyces tateyamensis TaxID=565073 RepID=A0A2V4NUP6_9ACTN|nr:flavodoxin family protein [Streptomyces tateyamensis]PYC80201.1 flavodoxin [Streptomyces tateyamensis]
MNTVIVCASVSHGNTRRVAEAIGRELSARVIEPGQLDPAELADYDLVGFGSGIFTGRFHPRLRAYVRAIPAGRPTRAFAFATSGLPGPRFRPLTRALEARGFQLCGTFSCRGLDTWLPFRLVGGINRAHPDTDDLAAARAFAAGLRDQAAGRG